MQIIKCQPHDRHFALASVKAALIPSVAFVFHDSFVMLPLISYCLRKYYHNYDRCLVQSRGLWREGGCGTGRIRTLIVVVLSTWCFSSEKVGGADGLRWWHRGEDWALSRVIVKKTPFAVGATTAY